MKKSLRAVWVAGGLCGLLMAGGVIGGCGSGHGTSTTPTPVSTTGTVGAPARLVRTWQLTHVSGGIAGSNQDVPPGTETLTFSANGTFTRTQSGRATQGTYRVTQRKTIFSDTDQIVITYSTTPEPEVAFQLTDTELTLGEEVTDGFVRQYTPLVVSSGG